MQGYYLGMPSHDPPPLHRLFVPSGSFPMVRSQRGEAWYKGRGYKHTPTQHSRNMPQRKQKEDPVLFQSSSFPFALGQAVNVEYKGNLYPAKVHRISVDQSTCTIKYDVNGTAEATGIASRSNKGVHEQHGSSEAEVGSPGEGAKAAKATEEGAITATKEGTITATEEGAITATEECTEAAIEAVTQAEEVPLPLEDVEPKFTTKKAVRALSNKFKKIMKQRQKRWKHKAHTSHGTPPISDCIANVLSPSL